MSSVLLLDSLGSGSKDHISGGEIPVILALEAFRFDPNMLQVEPAFNL
jgi:hypothetical protein